MAMDQSDIIYKICPQALWDAAQQSGQFEGAPVDLEDGYIHFSTASQVVETAGKHFKNQSDLLLLCVSIQKIQEGPHSLKWEASRGGDLFPHLYGPMALSAVVKCDPLPLGADGTHTFPDSFLK
ncbi:MAG: DUF952 domain-containing protein [Cohaesibacter sp.]|nr:DUF952 domain-containing protein [Cohaesibacter sp.]